MRRRLTPDCLHFSQRSQARSCADVFLATVQAPAVTTMIPRASRMDLTIATAPSTRSVTHPTPWPARDKLIASALEAGAVHVLFEVATGGVLLGAVVAILPKLLIRGAWPRPAFLCSTASQDY